MDEIISNISEEDEKVLNKDYNMLNFFGLVFPSIFTFVFLAVYQLVDGKFIGQYVGPYAIAAVNLYYPILSPLLAIGAMIGTGGNAYILWLIGQGKKEEANKVFNQIIEVSLVIAVVFALICLIFMNPIMRMLGATDGNIEYLHDYYLILTIFAPAILLQTELGILLIGEGRTVLAGVLTIVGGVLNIVLDYIFMAKLGMGTLGAAIATVIGYFVPVLYAFALYTKRGSSRYTFAFSKVNFRIIGRIFYNGSSEMVSTLASGVSSLMMNHIALNLAGEVGVSTVSIFLYVQFIIMAVFMGLATAAEPLFSYYHGKKEINKINKTFKICMIWAALFSVIMLVLVLIFSQQITSVFFDEGAGAAEFFNLANRSVILSAPAAIFVGVNILASGIFTAFGNGTVSAILSSARTFIVLVICLIIMPKLWGTDGLWLSWAAAEAISMILSVTFLVVYQKKYFK